MDAVAHLRCDTVSSTTTEININSSSSESDVPCTRDSAHKTFGSTDLTSTYSVCTRRVFRGTGIEPRSYGLESGALTTRLPTIFSMAAVAERL
ncbi:hypothetical protein TNCV_2817281 [Trichonephila clavipes]|nr:hypothetical protein TNCV_2817281 [Trichonephila clavipes]